MNIAARCSTFVLAAAGLLVLAGCTSDPKPIPTQSPTASSTPRPTPTLSPTATPAPIPTPAAELIPVDPLSTVTAIVVRPEFLELRDSADALVVTLSYDADTTTVVDTLASVLASEPSQTESAGGLESPPSTAYHWDGVRVWDDHEGSEGWGQIDMNVSVLFSLPVIGDGVSVRTSTGFEPGGDAQALAAELGQPWYGNGIDQVRAETGEPIGERNFGSYENAYSVAVNGWETDGRTGAVFAPWNFGIGHV